MYLERFVVTFLFCLDKKVSNVLIVSNCLRMHHYASLPSTYFQQFQFLNHRFKLRQKAPLSVLTFIFFPQHFQLPINRFKLRHKAPLSVLVFSALIVVLNYVRRRRLASLISRFSQQ